MKPYPLCFIYLLIFLSGLAANASTVVMPNAVLPSTDSLNIIRLNSKDQLMRTKMMLFSKLTLSDYEKLKGRKLNYFERLSFKLTQHRVNKMLKSYSYGDGPTVLQKISWLIKGLILGPIALLLGYLFLKDDDRELIKWIWFGFAGFVVWFTIFILALTAG